MTDIEKSLKLIPFSGKSEDWRMWSRKFLARAVVKKYREILLGEVVVPFDINGDEDEEAQLETQRYAQ
jgi:hypothetical protein